MAAEVLDLEMGGPGRQGAGKNGISGGNKVSHR